MHSTKRSPCWPYRYLQALWLFVSEFSVPHKTAVHDLLPVCCQPATAKCLRVQALAALAADPVASLVDTAFVGRLGGYERAQQLMRPSAYSFIGVRACLSTAS